MKVRSETEGSPKPDDRARAELTLERRLAAVERMSSDGLGVFATSGRLLRANSAARRLLGLGPAEDDLAAAHTACLVDDRGVPLADALNPLHLAIHQGLPAINIPVLWQRADGLISNLTMSFEPYAVADAPDAPREVAVLVRDAAEAAFLAGQVSQLRSDRLQQQHLMNLIFDNVDSGIALVDHDDRVALWNVPFAVLWGIEPFQGQPGPTTDRLLAQAAWDFTPAEQQQFAFAMTAARESFEPISLEVATASKAIHVYTCRLAGGRRLWAVRDLTERRRMTRELEAAKEQAEADRNLLQIVFANVESGILAVSREGQVLAFNPVFAQMWQLEGPWSEPGHEHAALLAAIRRWLDPAHFTTHARHLHELVERQGTDRLEIDTIDGRRIMVYTTPFGDDGRLFSCHDTTARYRLERSLAARNQELAEALARQQQTSARLTEANRALAEADRLKSEFLANTSHELRSPLNCILGYLGLILDGVSDDPDDIQSYAETAHKNAVHLAEVIADLLDVAKIESGRIEMDLEPVVLWLAIEEVAQSLKPLVDQKAIQLVLPPIDLDLLVHADAGRLRQVLLNVIGNALKFTAAGEVRIDTGVDGQTVRVTVTDTGIGIPREQQDRVFEKFVQADGSMQRAFGGTGLGLSITRSLIELMGGQIAIESAGEGCGTTVTIDLQRA